MDKDNVRLALWVAGVWGSLIILIVGIEAIVHDGAIATTIVDTFSKALFAIVAAIIGVTGLGKFFETSQVNTAAVAAAGSAPTPAEAASDAAGAAAVAAVSGPGVD